MDERLDGINDNSHIIRENSNRNNLTLSNDENHQLIDNSEDEQSNNSDQNDGEQRLPNQTADSTLVLHPIKITALYIAELAYLIDPKTKKPAKYDCPHCSKPICPKKGKQHITLDRSCKSCVEYDYCSHCTIRANQWRGKITMLYQHASTVPIDFIFVDATAGCDHRIRCEKCGHYKFCFSSHSCKKKDFLPLSAFDFGSPNFNSPTPSTSSPSSSSSPSPTLLSPATIHTHTPSHLPDHPNTFASTAAYHSNNIHPLNNHSANYNYPNILFPNNQPNLPASNVNVNNNNNIINNNIINNNNNNNNNNIDSNQNEMKENHLKISNTSNVILNSNISNIFSPLETLSFSPNSYETALAFEPPMPFNFDSPSLNSSININNINFPITNNNNNNMNDINNSIRISNNYINSIINKENEHDMEHDMDSNNNNHYMPMEFSHSEETNDAIDFLWKNTFGTMNDVDKLTFSHFISRVNIDGFGWEILKTTSLVADDDVFRESVFKDWFRRLGSTKPDSNNPYQAWCYFLYRVSQVAEAIIECTNIQTHSLSILKSNHHPESIVLSWNPRNNENEKRFRIKCTESGFRLYKDPLMRNYAYQDQSLINIIHKFIAEH